MGPVGGRIGIGIDRHCSVVDSRSMNTPELPECSLMLSASERHRPAVAGHQQTLTAGGSMARRIDVLRRAMTKAASRRLRRGRGSRYRHGGLDSQATAA